MIATSMGGREISSESGLISGHSYAVLAIFEFEHQWENVRLLKMRNPWGQLEIHGDWNSDSPLWTPELRDELGCQAGDQSSFFMTFEEYVDQFRSTSIAVYHETAPQSHS